MFKLNKYILWVLLGLAISSLALPSYAAKGGVKGGHYGKVDKKHVAKGVKGKNLRYTAQKPDKLSKFRYGDKNVITDYFDTHPYKVKTLPPGIAKNLARGKPWPPGIAKQYLPENLRLMLPERAGYDYLIAGHDVFLVDKTSNIIADVIANIIK